MKMNALCALGATLVAASAANAAYTGLSWESYTNADWTANGFSGLTAWRLYAEFSDPADMLIAVFGSPDNVLNVTSGDGLFHNSAIANTMTAPLDLSPGIWSNQWDTYVTIGLDTAAGDATGLSPGFETEVGSLAGSFSTNNASWFITPIDPQGIAGADGKVLLGQFVVAEGVNISGVLNMQFDGGVQALDQAFDTVPAPGALALLGLAGLVGRRRR